MSDPETPVTPPAGPPEPHDATPSSPQAHAPGMLEPSIWRTLDGKPIPRRATAPGGAHFTPPPNLTKAPTDGQAQFHQRGAAPSAPPLHPPPALPAAAPAPSPFPYAAAPRFTLATWWSRAGAYLIDGLVLGFGALLVTIPLCVAGGMTVEEAVTFLGLQQLPDSVSNPNLFYAVLVLQILAPPVAASVMLVRWNGQTIGKQALGIRVVRADGSPMTLRAAVRREVFAKTLLLGLFAVVTLGLAWLLNYLWPIWDAESRAGQDFVADTRVVQQPRDER